MTRNHRSQEGSLVPNGQFAISRCRDQLASAEADSHADAGWSLSPEKRDHIPLMNSSHNSSMHANRLYTITEVDDVSAPRSWETCWGTCWTRPRCWCASHWSPESGLLCGTGILTVAGRSSQTHCNTHTDTHTHTHTYPFIHVLYAVSQRHLDLVSKIFQWWHWRLYCIQKQQVFRRCITLLETIRLRY